MRILYIVAASLFFLALMASTPAKAQATALPERVTFPSADNHTILVGYLYRPLKARAHTPAVVMMHGRAGAYSSRANGIFNASTLSKRHRAWGEMLAAQGYFVLMVDGFGPRGYAQGFGMHSYNDRPEALNEVTVRPLDAYGALAFLHTLQGISRDRIGLLGWSNGGSATLAAMSSDKPGIKAANRGGGFRAAVAFYPACGLKDKFKEAPYRAYAPLRIFHGLADEETSPHRCAKLVEQSRANGDDVKITLYPGATHGFDDPGEKRQSLEANAKAAELATAVTLQFFADTLR